MKNNGREHRAFTLIELLVVLAVLTVSAVTLVAALNQTGGRGRTMQCLDNMRRLALAGQRYTSDNDGKLPVGTGSGGFHIIGPLANYLGVKVDTNRLFDQFYIGGVCTTKPVLRCPAWPANKLPTDTGLQYAVNNIDYAKWARNGTYSPVGPQGQKLSALPQGHLAEIALFVELSSERFLDLIQYDIHDPRHTTFALNGNKNPTQQVRMIHAEDKRHEGYTTLSFMDGHVEVRALRKEEVGFNPIFNPLDFYGPF